jgi:hypothetical protein
MLTAHPVYKHQYINDSVGDAVKVGGAVGLFVTKYLDKGGDVAKILGKYAFPNAPDIVKLC